MEHSKQDSLFGDQAEHYPVGFAQEISSRVHRLQQREIQLLDIKSLNDLAAEYRARIRTLISSYRSIRELEEHDTVRQVYASYETIFIRRQIFDLWKLYRIALSDSQEMTADYMATLNGKQDKRASLPTEKEDYRAVA